jgi:hypothetical protein
MKHEEMAMAKVQFEVTDVTPKDAQDWLAAARNRTKVDERAVAAYARDMKAGVWKLNGEPIILSSAGQLLTGRARLMACIKAETPFPTLVVHNIDDSHFETIDSVRKRTVADILTIRREPDGRVLAAALTFLWRFGSGDLIRARQRVSSSQLLAILQENPDVRASVRLTRAVRKIIPQGTAAALHYLFAQANEKRAAAFFSQIAGADHSPHSSVVALVRQLDDARKNGGAISQPYVAGLTIRAWDAFLKGREVTLLRYNPANDTFPKIDELPLNLALDGVVRADRSIRDSNDAVASELNVRVEQITPERASEILSRNDGNRSIASAVVEKYARDISRGNWVLNGQTIKIGKTGRLLDGQHRCAAAIKAKRGFEAIVVTGLDESIFDTFDLGARRSVGDILIDRGEQNTSTLAAVLRQLWLLQNGLLQYRAVSPTISELLDTLEKHPEIRESVRLSSRIRDVVAPSLACALHYLFSRVDGRRADEFISRLGDGLYLDDVSHPVWKLRKRLLDDRASKKRDMSDAEKAAIIVKAWNAFFKGEPLFTLKWQNSGPKKEDFPAILGLPQEVNARGQEAA